MNVIDAIEAEQLRQRHPRVPAGDSVKVHVKVVEGDEDASRCSRAPSCVAAMAASARRSPCARSYGVGVEAHLPDPLAAHRQGRDHARQGPSREAVYLRELSGKAARIKEVGRR